MNKDVTLSEIDVKYLRPKKASSVQSPEGRGKGSFILHPSFSILHLPSLWWNFNYTEIYWFSQGQQTWKKGDDCDQCDGIYSQKNNLYVHKESKHSGSNYDWNQCDSS